MALEADRLPNYGKATRSPNVSSHIAPPVYRRHTVQLPPLAAQFLHARQFLHAVQVPFPYGVHVAAWTTPCSW
jgi:hypothetical protein